MSVSRGLRRLPLCTSAVVGIGSALFGLWKPTRADYVAVLTEVSTPEGVWKAVRRAVEASEEGRDLLRDRPQWTSMILGQHSSISTWISESGFAPGTLGAAYGEWLLKHGYSPEERLPVRFLGHSDDAARSKSSQQTKADPADATPTTTEGSDPTPPGFASLVAPEVFLLERYRQVHDLAHVLFGADTDVQSEVALKWFELYQLGFPQTLLSALVGPFANPPKPSPQKTASSTSAGSSSSSSSSGSSSSLPPPRTDVVDRRYLVGVQVPWAIQQARSVRPNGAPLLAVYWERYLHENLEELRRAWGVETLPTK